MINFRHGSSGMGQCHCHAGDIEVLVAGALVTLGLISIFLRMLEF